MILIFTWAGFFFFLVIFTLFLENNKADLAALEFPL
jgi:hypothetical protein